MNSSGDAAAPTADAATSNKVLTGFVERIKKYTKKWARRFCTFDPTSRKFTYSEADKEDAPAKAFMVLSKVVRCAESRDNLIGPDLFTMLLEGTLDGATDGKQEQWHMRFGNEETFDLWYEVMRRSLATAGLMDPFNYGLPKVDPRQNLTFARVPLTHLLKFGLLEKAIMYSFITLRYMDITTNAPVDGVLVVGDKLLYLFRTNADVVRCTQLVNIKQLHYSKGSDLLGIALTPPEADIVLQFPEKIDEAKHVISVQFRAMSQGRAVAVVPVVETKLEAFAATMRMKHDEGYKMEVASPTAKSRLKHALDQYEKEQGVKFDPSTHKARKTNNDAVKRQNSVGLPTAGSTSPSGGGAGASGGGGSLDGSTVPLVRLLHRLELGQYAAQLLKQHVDVDVLQCMDLVDLETFGVKNKEHGQRILDAANDAALVASILASPSEGSGGGGGAAAAVPSTQPAAPASPSGAQQSAAGAAATGSPNATRPPAITLSDDDDDLDVLVQTASAKKPVIVLDDSDDDDLDLLPMVAASPSAAAKAPIILPDDDDI